MSPAMRKLIDALGRYRIFQSPAVSMVISGLDGGADELYAALSAAITVRLQLPFPTPTWQSKAMVLTPWGSPSMTFQTLE